MFFLCGMETLETRFHMTVTNDQQNQSRYQLSHRNNGLKAVLSFHICVSSYISFSKVPSPAHRAAVFFIYCTLVKVTYVVDSVGSIWAIKAIYYNL